MTRMRWVLLAVVVLVVVIGLYFGVREYLAAQAPALIHN